ncbi:hypothetical protein [Geomicrobium sp. JCM 19038]|uniref:hypothetical protein n=1 Tax=Geomicrobium sp. JCM 19038 TaxID=1460635 RepID=UPI00045F4B90|nr:hypothetical protein [Geomicrobium sp. JCM 19038]GAK08152.1 hypothetical protein JCM19038_1925 [Geomicrobium sp. JCM 19038]
MFTIVRVRNGVTETLKDSSSHLEKIFVDSITASHLAFALNRHLLPNATKWEIRSI